MLSDGQIRNRIQTGRYSKNDIKNLLLMATSKGKTARAEMIRSLVDSNFNVLNPIDPDTVAVETTKTERKRILASDYENPDIQIANKFLQIRESALNRNLEFNLSLMDVKKLLNKKKCHYSGRSFGEGQDIRTFDRLDSSLGYIKGNVVACTKRFNDIKNELFEKPDGALRCSVKEMIKFLEVISK